MLQSVDYLLSTINVSGYKVYYYKVTDSEFVENIILYRQERYILITEVARIYEKKIHGDVAHNIALLYSQLFDLNNVNTIKFFDSLKQDNASIQFHAPSLKYNQYFNCIKNKLAYKFWARNK